MHHCSVVLLYKNVTRTEKKEQTPGITPWVVGRTVKCYLETNLHVGRVEVRLCWMMFEKLGNVQTWGMFANTYVFTFLNFHLKVPLWARFPEKVILGHRCSGENTCTVETFIKYLAQQERKRLQLQSLIWRHIYYAFCTFYSVKNLGCVAYSVFI